MAWAAQGDCAKRDAGGCYKKSRQSGWDRFIRRYPGRGTVPRGVEVSPVDSRLDARDIELAIRDFARFPNSGLMLTPNAGAMPAGYKLVIALSAELKLPTIYPFANMVAEGGLICHSTNPVDESRRAADYVDRILKGEKPGDLPVQALTKYEVVINLKTAKALGLTVSPALLAQANKVIE
jgi:ABC-type uncharacterized transport system substrate-binding protein